MGQGMGEKVEQGENGILVSDDGMMAETESGGAVDFVRKASKCAPRGEGRPASGGDIRWSEEPRDCAETTLEWEGFFLGCQQHCEGRR